MLVEDIAESYVCPTDHVVADQQSCLIRQWQHEYNDRSLQSDDIRGDNEQGSDVFVVDADPGERNHHQDLKSAVGHSELDIVSQHPQERRSRRAR